MRYTSTTSRSRGFTLIEVLIIAPIVVIAISGFVAIMVTMVGNVLQAREQNTLVYETQDALDRIEQDTRLTTRFLTTSGGQPSPQGSNNNATGTAAFTATAGGALILSSFATTKNPVDTTRELVYYANQPYACSAQKTYNKVFLIKIIYYINAGSLWRRTIVPTHNTTTPVNADTVCQAPWQRNTCSPGYSPSGTPCQTNDSEVMKNIDTLSVKYLSTQDSTVDLGPGQALNANAIEVAITGKKTTAGRDVAAAGSMRGTKLNSTDLDSPPTTPVVTGQANETTAIFSWPAIPVATSYLITYRVNGGSWSSATNDSITTAFSINANRNDLVEITVAAKNSTATSPAAPASVTMPPWYPCGLQGSDWVNFGGVFAPSSYTKTSGDIVALKGLIKTSGPVTLGTVLCTLPVGYRPTDRLVFLTSTSGGVEGTPARVDVLPDGKVVLDYGVNSGWLSLDGIKFVASTAPYTWTDLPLSSEGGWANYGGSFADIRSTTDNLGRVHVQGLLKGGISTDWTIAATLPAGQRPSHFMLFPAASNTPFNSFGVTSGGPIVARGTNGSTYWSIQSSFYPASFNSWTNLPLAYGWIAYDATNYSPPQYTKAADGRVTVRGIIKNGVATAGTVIATLPPGYWPSERLVFTVVAGGALGRIDILTDGKIEIRSANSGFTSLDSITFLAQ